MEYKKNILAVLVHDKGADDLGIPDLTTRLKYASEESLLTDFFRGLWLSDTHLTNAARLAFVLWKDKYLDETDMWLNELNKEFSGIPIVDIECQVKEDAGLYLISITYQATLH